MEFFYYIGDGPEAEALVIDTQEKLSARNEARHFLCFEYGAQGVFESRSGVYGLVFKERQEAPHLKLIKESDGYYTYKPRLNSKAGRVLASRLAYKSLTFDTSDYIVGKLGLHRTVVGSHQGSRTGMALYNSVAGFGGGKIIVKVPGDAEGGEPMPLVPEWLRQVKESEFLAAQGR